MRAVQLSAYDGRPESISVVEMPVPRPGPGEVLVRVHASPLNPSDDLFIRGLYGFRKPLPTVPGFEGSGTVVEAGRGALARFLNGKRVACTAAAANIDGGMWAQYAAVPAPFCVPLRKIVALDQGATMLINPLTAWALIDEARRGGHSAVVQTAAASSLGQMVIRLGRRFSISVINVVRRPEQITTLQNLGAEHVLSSNDPGFADNLRKLCHELGAGIGFDAVAGEMSATILRAQPRGSRLLVYGILSMTPSQIDPASLIFEDKRVEGFYLVEWLKHKNPLAQLLLARRIQTFLANDLKTDIQARLPLEDVARGLKQYASRMTGGKILLMP
jgi:NADPH:quinone reductase-like Zn-dependent oxidoreductase